MAKTVLIIAHIGAGKHVEMATAIARASVTPINVVAIDPAQMLKTTSVVPFDTPPTPIKALIDLPEVKYTQKDVHRRDKDNFITGKKLPKRKRK